MSDTKKTGSPLVAILVIVLSLTAVMVIYYLTVGSKVSHPTDDSLPVSSPGEGPDPTTPPGTGPGDSHAVEVDDSEAVTKPAEDKKDLPPGVTAGPGQ